VERIIRFEADGVPPAAGDTYPGRELAEHLAAGLASFARVVSGPEERDHGWDTGCESEGRRVWVLLQEDLPRGRPPGWVLRIGWTGDWGAELRELLTWGRRRRRMREWFERFCGRVEEGLRADPRVREVRPGP
jgi:hypothetical protein